VKSCLLLINMVLLLITVLKGESFNKFWAGYGNTFPTQFVRVAAVVKLN